VFLVPLETGTLRALASEVDDVIGAPALPVHQALSNVPDIPGQQIALGCLFDAEEPAYCEIDVGFDVDWLCTLIIAEMSGSGARA